MSISERAPDDAASDDQLTTGTALEPVPVDLDLVEPEGPPRWPAATSRPTGSHHAYPAPYPAPWGGDDGAANGDGGSAESESSASSGPSGTLIAICLAVGVSLFALGAALMTIVI